MTCKQTGRLSEALRRKRKAFGTTGPNTQAAQMREARRQAQAIASLLGAAA